MLAERCRDESDESEEDESDVSPVSASDAFSSECQHAMAASMTYDEYWCGEPEIYEYKMREYLSSVDEERAKEDRMAWLIGLYVCEAHGVNLSNAFAKRGSKLREYFREPQLSTFDGKNARERKQEQKAINAHSSFMAMARALGVKIDEAASE